MGLVGAVVSPPVGAATPERSAIGPADTPAESPIQGSPLSLPFGTFEHMLVDQAAGKIFYSGIANGFDGAVGGVAASSLTGTDLQLVSGTSDATGLAIGPDGLVYAGESTDSKIVAIDPSTLTVTATYSSGDGGCPNSVAFAGNDLWFSFTCGPDPNEYGIAELNRDTRAVSVQGAVNYANPLVAGIPGHPDELLATYFGGAYEIDLLHVSGGTATPTGIVAQGTDAYDLEVSPDGSTVLAYGVPYSTTDLSNDGTRYSPASGAGALTNVYSPDGQHVAVSDDTVNLSIFVTDSKLELHPYLAPYSTGSGDATQLTLDGLAWTSNTTLAVAFQDSSGSTPQIRFVTDPLAAPSAITLTSPATATRAKAFTFTGTFTNVQDPTGLQLSVSRRDASGLVGLTPVTLGADGTFSVTDTPPVGSTNVYTVSYVGSQHFGPAKAAVSVAVSRDLSSLTIHTDRALYPVGATMTVTVHLGPHYNLSQISLYATPGGSYQRLLARPTVDAAGNAVVRVKYSYSTSFVATFAGDYRFAPISTSAIARVAVRLTPSLRGGYTTSGGYTLFHAGSYATPGAQVLPLKPGQCVSFTLQYYSGGRWLNGVGLPCSRLSSASVTSASFTERAGLPWRLQLSYRTDTTNSGAASSWIYLRWV